MGSIQKLHRAQMGVSGYIKFVDPVVAQICADNWGDGKGITYKQAAAVKSIGNVFKGNTEITSFDEFGKFTGVTTLDNNSFTNCSNLASIDISNIEIIYGNANIAAFYKSGLQEVYAPNLKELKLSSSSAPFSAHFCGSSIKRVTSLGEIVKIKGGNATYGAFGSCPYLEFVRLPHTLSLIGYSTFRKSPLLSVLICEADVPPTLEAAAFYETPIASGTGYIYVPDASVDAYKEATNWVTYAAQIKPLSEYNG